MPETTTTRIPIEDVAASMLYQPDPEPVDEPEQEEEQLEETAQDDEIGEAESETDKPSQKKPLTKIRQTKIVRTPTLTN